VGRGKKTPRKNESKRQQKWAWRRRSGKREEEEEEERPQKGALVEGIGVCVCFHPCLCLSILSKYTLFGDLFLNSFSIWESICTL
jgi:hypothetical protein